MNFSRSSAQAAAFGAAALILAACNGGGAGLSLTPSTSPQPPGTAGLPPALATRMASSLGLGPTGHSWMSPDAKKAGALLYSSNALNNQVSVFAAKGKNSKLVGKLVGFDEPYGECADKAGNVYITNLLGQTVVEYAHGGTSPIKTLNDSYGQPGGCAVNTKTGDLAVTNFEGGASGYGNLVIYSGASGSGTPYAVTADSFVWAPVYDNRGNLFFETQNGSTRQTYLAELPSGGSTVQPVTLPSGVTIYSPSGATWDGTYVGVTDEEYQDTSDEGVYRVSLSGSTATLASQTEYTDTCYSNASLVVQPIVYKGDFIGGNFWCYYSYEYRIDYWNYEAGGNPVRYINGQQTTDTSYGQAISK
jgi:hypothetical protein